MDVISPDEAGVRARGGSVAAAAIAAAVLLLHLCTNMRYGLHRDELQVLSDAMHLDWGYVTYPPLTPFLERIAHGLFGLSLVGLRLFSALAQAAIVLTTALMVRELGGGRLARGAAALAVALAPIALFEGTEFQYSSYEQFAWVLATYGVVRLLTSDDPRWWVWVGVFAAMGLLAKYTVVLFVVSLLLGFVLSPARRLMRNRWFVLGCLVAMLLLLPNVIWQMRHNFVSYHFLQHIHARDVRIGRGSAKQFWLGQTLLCANAFALPLWVVGVVAALRSRRYRPLGLGFVLTVALLAISRGRGYYQAAAFPVVIAVGAVAAEAWLGARRAKVQRVIVGVWIAGVLAYGAFVAAVLIPFASSGPLREFALRHNEDLREEIGWDELVQSVVAIRDSLPIEQQQQVGILASNYGEAGAVEMLGPQYHLPPPINWTNSGWLRGYPSPPPLTIIVLGLDRDEADARFTGCRVAGHVSNRDNIRNEESRSHSDIFLCGPPRLPWPEFWRREQHFG